MMVKYVQRFCDFCGSPAVEFDGSLIIKRRWCFWNEVGWSRLDICTDCAAALEEEIKKKLEEKNEQISMDGSYGG